MEKNSFQKNYCKKLIPEGIIYVPESLFWKSCYGKLIMKCMSCVLEILCYKFYCGKYFPEENFRNPLLEIHESVFQIISKTDNPEVTLRIKWLF